MHDMKTVNCHHIFIDFWSACVPVAAGHEAGPPAPAPLLGPLLLSPPSRRRQTAHPPRLAQWQRPPPDAAAGRGAGQSGRGRRQRRLGSSERQHPEASTEENPEPSLPAAPRSRERGRSEGSGAAAEAQRRAAAVHRPDLPSAEEYDPDGQNGEPAGAGSAQPQSPRRDREMRLPLWTARLLFHNQDLSFCLCACLLRLFTHRWCQITHRSNPDMTSKDLETGTDISCHPPGLLTPSLTPQTHLPLSCALLVESCRASLDFTESHFWCFGLLDFNISCVKFKYTISCFTGSSQCFTCFSFNLNT